ncbi:MAG TPA: hypothetical protein VGP15_20940 [Burkholderiales bacterium]|nr:hypothetical protein [Burkholderiales bacterium]
MRLLEHDSRGVDAWVIQRVVTPAHRMQVREIITHASYREVMGIPGAPELFTLMQAGAYTSTGYFIEAHPP